MLRAEQAQGTTQVPGFTDERTGKSVQPTVSEILLPAGPHGPADPPDSQTEFHPVDGVETRQDRSRAVRLAAADPHDCSPLAVPEREVHHRQVERRAGDVAQQVLGSEPALPLEGVAGEFSSSPEFDREVAPPRPEVFRQVFHTREWTRWLKSPLIRSIVTVYRYFADRFDDIRKLLILSDTSDVLLR